MSRACLERAQNIDAMQTQKQEEHTHPGDPLLK